ncbi:ABC transporter permease [Nonomuraea sp. NPDC046570]|uniref:ABC transporter permease n=1 Tax=Nonomuraea sp. NPDC046570 TaxID=3155255 RepID=UPI0033F04A05
MRELVAVARFGGRVYWRDKVALTTSVALSLGLGIGLPMALGRIGGSRPGMLLDMHLGLLAMVLTITALNQAAVTLSARRDQLILKRMRATGLSDRDILGGEILNIAAQSVLVAAVISIVLHTAGGLRAPAVPLAYALFVVAGAGVLALLGAAYTAVISRAELAAVLTMPFFLLAGLGGGGFGPLRQLLPGWAQTVLDLLPSGAVVDAARVAHTGGAASGYLLPALNLAVWAAIGLAALRYRFRWESRKS